MAVTDEVLSVARIRAAEARTMEHTPEDVLMDRAAHAVAQACLALADERGLARTGLRVCVVAGSGNNGGDALLAGAELARGGAQVVAVVVGERAHPRGMRTLTEAAGPYAISGIDFPLGRERVIDAQLVIDGFSGIGGRSGLSDQAWSLLGRAVEAGTCIVAVDVPSGLAADSPAAPERHVRADVTVTFTAMKRCLVEDPAAASAGRVVLADVGIDL